MRRNGRRRKVRRNEESEGMIGRVRGNSEMNITRNNGAKVERGKALKKEK